MNIRTIAAAAGIGTVLILGGCAASTTAALVADAPSLIAAGEALLTAYEGTPNPSAPVVSEANQLLAAAEAANTTYGATSSEALAAAAALTAYLATSAPGNGVTPSTIPVASTPAT